MSNSHPLNGSHHRKYEVGINSLIGWGSNLLNYINDILDFPGNLHSSHGGDKDALSILFVC